MQNIVTITHSQINIFDASEPDFNLWDDDHVAQGFSWRKGSVSFGVPDHDGQCLVETRLVDTFPSLDDQVLRAIRVPFSASQSPYIATIVDEFQTDIPSGEYEVEFHLRTGSSHGDEEYDYLVEFFFKSGTNNEFTILRKSGEMTSDKIITTQANPAR